MSFKLLKKVVSIFTLTTFIFSNIYTNSVYAAPNSKSIFKNKKVNYKQINDKNEEAIQKKKAILSGEDVNQAVSQKKETKRILSSHLSDISLIHIPEEIGRVVEAYQNPKQDNSRLVVHIQDLHTNPEASLHLASILEILVKDYNLGLVCSEGADGEVDTSSVSSFPDAETREKVAKLFVDSGELTGEEYLSITKYPKLAIWGIENKEIYFKNIEEFNSIMKFNPESQVFISQAKKALEELKPRVYSKELLAIGQKESDYENQKVETADYLKYLSGYIQKLSIPTTNYKNVGLLNETISQESKIDQQKIMQELQNLLMNLQSAIAGESNRSDMDTLMAKASLFKDQKISPFSFYSYLKDLADKYLKGQLSKYPNITEFTDYLAKVNSLDSAKLFTEMEDLTYEIKQRLARNDEERKLTQASRNIKFLEGFFNLKVSNEELDYYLENRDSHKVAFFEAFLKPELQKYNISSFVDFNPSLIDSHLQELEDFYKTAKSRDIEMFNNTISEIEKRNVKVTALVTGGFHTRGLTQLLKDKGYSYIVISPYSKTEIDEENYHFLLSGKRKPIEELINQLDIPADKTNKVSANLRVPMAFRKNSANPTADRIINFTGNVPNVASNQDLKLACENAQISLEALSEIVDAYSFIYKGSRKAEGINLSIERIGLDKIRSVLQDKILTDQEKLLVLRYIVFGKGSILTFWDELDDEGKKRLLTQMEMLDLDSIEKLYKRFILEKQSGAEVKVTNSNLAMPSIIDISDVSLPAYGQAMEEGAKAFKNGEVCFLELAGGSGSRLGYEHAKIMLQTSQIMNMSLGRMRAKKIRAVAEKYGKPMPWLIMTSDVTDVEVRKFFEKNLENGKYFGEVPVSWVRFIRQQVMPQVTTSGEFILVKTKDNIVVGGYGHGDARDYVLRNASIQEWLKRFGIRYIVALNVDNAYMPSALSVGYHIINTRDLPLGTERLSVHSVEKSNPEEKVGMNVLIRDPKNPVKGDFRSAVIEYNQIPDNFLYMTYEYVLDGEKIVFLKENGKFAILTEKELQEKYRGSFKNAVWVRENIVNLQTVLSGLKEGERIKHSAIEYDKETLPHARLWLLLGNTNGLIWTLDPFLDEKHLLQDAPVLVARNKKVAGYHPESGRYHTQEDGVLKADKFESMAFHGFFGNPVMGAFILVPRAGYFAPIKDAEGKGADTLSRAKRIFTQYESELLQQKRNWTVESAVVELSPAVSFLDGSDLKKHVGEYGFVGDGAKLYLSGKNTYIGNRFNVKNNAVFILRFNEEYNERSAARIGNTVEVDGDISFEVNGSGQLIIDDDVWLTGNKQYKIESGEILHITRGGELRSLASAEEAPATESKGSVLGLLYVLADNPPEEEEFTVLDVQKNRINLTREGQRPYSRDTVRNELNDAVALGLLEKIPAKRRDLPDKYKVIKPLTKRQIEALVPSIQEKLNRGRINAEETGEIRDAIQKATDMKLASNEGAPANLQKAVEGNKGAYLAIKNINPNDVIAYFEAGLADTVTNLPEDLFGRGFGYDIRGNAMEIQGGFIDMTPANLYAIGKLLAAKYCSPGDRFLVTGDMRMHTPILRYAMVLGAASVGVSVDFSEEALSSGAHNVYSAENSKGYKVQVQMSGSHGVFQKNGAKIKAEIGNNRLDPVYAEELARLHTDRQEILATAETRNTKDARIQEVSGIEDAIADMYDKSLPKTDKDEILVIDTRAGGGGSLAAKLLAKRGYEVIDIDDVFGILGQAVDMTDLLGDRNNIAKILSILNSNWQSGKHKIVFMLNMHPDPLMRRGIWDPSKPEAMVPTATLIKAINSSLKEGMPEAIGGVYDGDADRVGAVKENGEDIPAFEMTIPYYQRFLLDPRNKAAIIQMVKAGGGPLWLACDVRANSKLNRTISKLGGLLKEEGGLSIDPLKAVYINTGYPPQLGFIAWRIQQMKEFVESKPELTNDPVFMANFINLIHTYYTAEASGHNFFHASPGNPERPSDCAIAAFISLINIRETMADIEVPALKMQGDTNSLMRLFETFPPAITSNEIRVVIPNAVKIVTTHKLGAWLQEKYGVQLLEQRTEKTKIGDLELQPVEDGLVTVAGYKAQLKNGDSILIRWSNTGEQLTLLFEGHDINSLINNVETVLNRMKEEQQDVHGLNLSDLEKELADLKQKRDSPRLGKYRAVAENISSSI